MCKIETKFLVRTVENTGSKPLEISKPLSLSQARMSFVEWQTFDFSLTRIPRSQTENSTLENKHGSEFCEKVFNEKNIGAVGANSYFKTLENEKSGKITWKRRWKSGNIVVLALPLGAAILPIIFIISAFIHADRTNSLVLLNNTDTPYVSDIGNFKPYSSLFTFGLFLNAIFFISIVIVRYFHVKSKHICKRANFASLTCGIICTLGELLTSCFQISSHYHMHFLGAFLYFVFIAIFYGFQTFITYHEIQASGTKRFPVKVIFAMRLLLTFIIGIILVLFGTFLHPDLSGFNRVGSSIAQVMEWMLVSLINVFLLTFLFEFKDIKPEFSVAPILPEHLEHSTA